MNHPGVLAHFFILLQFFFAQVQAQGSGADPYAPVYTSCPQDLSIRAASTGLSDNEKAWRDLHAKQIIPELKSYLTLANISGFDIQQYIDQINATNLPIVGLSVSGGGTQSGLGGLGIWQAYDARNPGAIASRTGGLSQILSYMTGLSGGGAITVGIIAANNFSTTAQIRTTTNFSVPYSNPTGNFTQFFTEIFENTGAKAEAGFPVSVVDPFGQFWGNWLPPNATFANYSDLANPTNNGAFALGTAPMPIMVLAEVIPGKSPGIGKIMYPGFNSTNQFNLTSYEVTPFEFGSWAGGRVQAFIPTQYLGTSMSNGKPQNDSVCAVGFDKLTFIQGTTACAFNAWFIDAFYQIPVFAKRELESRQQQQADIPIPPGQQDNPLVYLVNQTAVNFNQTFNDSMWGTYPNPFQDYNDDMKNVDELLLIDGSLTGETNPIRPLIIPERRVDFIIVYEASSDSKYYWVNGTNLINTQKSASEGNIPFPQIPDVKTMVTQNLTKQPTFFGCNASDSTPLVLYLPNSPWSGYTNFSYMQDSFTNNQLNATLDNAFQLATYGNGTVDANWPACLACATIKKSAKRVNVTLPPVCTSCFNQHCWNGTNSTADITDADTNPRLRLNSSVSFEQWNTTVWGGNSTSQTSNSTSGTEKDEKDGSAGLVRPLGTSAFAVVMAVLIAMIMG
ncbi:unnamed protein product [Clonostachys rhizophaga]|uniref:Lysophospholipase n=1 Tax=Clonostachys rhizophaga TaxID=160324 RepID=A0A9N9VBH1_9HYPO|nr:unnamed protein product [Clonostachys rhizophaga]